MTTSPGEAIDARTWKLCWVIVLGAFASGLDSSIVSVGLDSISRTLQAPLSTVQWSSSGYLLALAVSLPTAGWLTHRLGSGRLWLFALAGFTIASIGCAAAPTAGLLIAARVIQGLLGGLLIPTGQAILGQAVGPQRLGRVMGTLGIAVSAAPAVGSVMGGVILHIASWPWLFLVNVPIGIAGFSLGLKLVPRGDRSPDQPLHRSGFGLIGLGLPMLVYAASRWGDVGRFTVDATVAGCIAVVALTSFVAVTLPAQYPLLNLKLYTSARFRAGAISALFSGALVFGSGVLFALYFQVGRGQTALGAGFSLLGVAAATTLAAPFTGRLVDRRGPGPVALGGSVLATATAVPLTISPFSTPMPVIEVLLILFGIAVSLTAMPAGIAAYKAVKPEQLPDAITQVNIIQRLGGSLGGAICAALIARTSDSRDTAFSAAFLALLIYCCGSFVGAWLIWRASRHARETLERTRPPHVGSVRIRPPSGRP